MPDERVFGDGAEGRLAAHLGDPDRSHGDAVDSDVPVVAGREVRHVERRGAFVVALDVAPEGACERASAERSVFGAAGLVDVRLVARALGLGGGRAGGLGATGFAARRAPATAPGLALTPRRGRVRDRARLGHFGAQLDDVPALAALHADGLAGDLLVRDLVLRLALFAEELHRRPLRELTVPDRHVIKEGRASARGDGAGQISCRRCSLTDARVASSGARAAHRSHISTALFLKPAFS